MEDKKILPVLVLLSLIAGAMIGYYFPKQESGKLETMIQPVVNVNPNPTITVSTISQSDEIFNINAQYPQFSLVNPSFNKKISDLINTRLSEFKKSSQENLKAMKETITVGEPMPDWKFYFKADWEPAQINKDYISVVVNVYSFSGGAHGDSEVYTFNYDLASKKEITFSNFIGDSQENLKTISRLAIEDLVNQRANFGETNSKDIKKELEEGGAAPIFDNFNYFTFDNDMVTVYYQKYQVGAGAMGIMKTSFQKSYLIDQSISSKYLK
ncbi:DUF3298 and DUF4163 domain-containing protein [bacterium]|nr:DUF3298 and DUF4163 domain-containing protein [bacterium]